MKEPEKARAVSGKNEAFCSGFLELSQGSKPTHEVSWEEGAGVSCWELQDTGCADLRFVALALLSVLHQWWRVRKKVRFWKEGIGIPLPLLCSHTNRGKLQ